jgi:glycosyltransferase involved in cell wall biosynthesis
MSAGAGRGRRAAIVTPVIHARDAVGTDTLEMAAALRRDGWEVELFCETARGIAEKVSATRKATAWAADPEDVLVYHFSFGWPGALPLLRGARCRRVVKYHNVTPPEFFAPYSPAHVRACGEGRAAIAEIVALGCERYIADSAYNLAELVAAGLPHARGGVVPPFSRVERLVATPADLRFIDRWAHGSAPQFLMVGRIAPNKGHLALIDGLAAFNARTGRDARLFVLGIQDSRLRGYRDVVEARIQRHGLASHVVFIEDANEGELKASYLVADAFVVASEHEGFCVPVVEAMALGVPVVSGNATALPETVGDAGIVVDAADPDGLADAMGRVVSDASLRRRLARSGRVRAADRFGTDAVAARLSHELAQVA